MLCLKTFVHAFVFNKMKELMKTIQHIRKASYRVQHWLFGKCLYKHCLLSSVNTWYVKITISQQRPSSVCVQVTLFQGVTGVYAVSLLPVRTVLCLHWKWPVHQPTNQPTQQPQRTVRDGAHVPPCNRLFIGFPENVPVLAGCHLDKEQSS